MSTRELAHITIDPSWRSFVIVCSGCRHWSAVRLTREAAESAAFDHAERAHADEKAAKSMRRNEQRRRVGK